VAAELILKLVLVKQSGRKEVEGGGVCSGSVGGGGE